MQILIRETGKKKLPATPSAPWRKLAACLKLQQNNKFCSERNYITSEDTPRRVP